MSTRDVRKALQPKKAASGSNHQTQSQSRGWTSADRNMLSALPRCGKLEKSFDTERLTVRGNPWLQSIHGISSKSTSATNQRPGRTRRPVRRAIKKSNNTTQLI